MTGISTNIIGVSVLDQYALTTVDNVRVQLGIPTSALTFDLIKKFERMINAASTHLEEYMKRRILQRTYVEFQDSRGGNFIVTSEYPIISVTEFWIDATRAFTDTVNNLLPTTAYAISDEDMTIQTLDRNLPHGRHVIKVVYVGGFVTVPHDISRAADMLVEWWYRFNEREDIGRTNKSKGDESTVISQDIPTTVKALVRSYRRMDLVGAAPRTMAVT